MSLSAQSICCHRALSGAEKSGGRSRRYAMRKEAAIIAGAKQLLMARNTHDGGEAHRYLQKHSMDNGTNLGRGAAQMLLALKQ